MNLKLKQMNLRNRMRRMAARRRKSRKNRSSRFCESCAFSRRFRRCQVPDSLSGSNQVKPIYMGFERQCRLEAVSPCQEYAQTSNHE